VDDVVVEGTPLGGPQTPVADFSGSPLSGDAPLTVSFTDLSTNSPTSWDWTFGDGGSSTAQNPSHDYTSEGDYTVSLTAANASGSDTETKTDYISVSAAPPPPPVAEFVGSPLSGDAPLTVNFTDQSTNSPTSWDWDFGDTSTSTAQNPGHDYTSEGDYTVALTATNAGGSDTETKTNYISVSAAPPPPPVAEFVGSPLSGTAPLTVNFTDQSTNSPTSWDWDFGDTSTSTAQNPSHDYTGAGDYTVALTATNAGGSDTETKTDYISVTSGGQQVTIWADHFENGVANWTATGSPSLCDCPSEGEHFVRIRNDEAFERTISTVGYTDIVVEFDITATGLDGDDNVQALWYDGSTWTVMKQINDGDPDEDWEFDRYQFSLPAAANNNADFAVKFAINNCDGYDENGRFDDFKVLGTN
jgi:PKD repeat protein